MVYTRTVRFHDTDAAGVVYFANVLSFCHEAYEESLMLSQIDLRRFFSHADYAIPLVHAHVDFYKPIFCGDRIAIYIKPNKLNDSTFEIDYKIVLLEQQDTVLAKAVTKHVCIHPQTRKKRPLPSDILVWLREEYSDHFMQNLDTVLRWNDGKTYFFKQDEYLSYDIHRLCLDFGYPKKINQGKWSILPADFTQNLDAALLWNNGKALFFKGEYYLAFDLYRNQVEFGYPQKLNSGNWSGWPNHFLTGIDAAILWNNGKAYFFKDDEYLRFDTYKEMTDLGYPKKITEENWHGWPQNFQQGIDAAVAWDNSKAYFFKDDEYISYNMNQGCVDPGYPKKISETWSGSWC